LGRRLIPTSSVPVLERPEDGAPLVTELVTGEELKVVRDHGIWLEVVVPGHATRLDPRGYPGWTRPDGLLEGAGWSPDLVVVARNDAGLPLGALLRSDGGSARLPDGNAVAVGSDAVLPVGGSVRASAVEISRTLLDLPYRWGGTDSTAGMDCSGMVFRVMQLLGITVPRDAEDQYASAPFKSRRGWEEAEVGDLIFFGKESVTHVGLCLGDGAYVSEHGAGGTMVRGVGEDHYWGFARYS
jgi:gamma-D-glutamyl-L-lysine dipeptidyl-peptidase